MNAAEKSGALDYFRLTAAILVIAIHISPLESLAPTADFFLTRVLARTAVPFFFMTTGMFTDFERPQKAIVKLTKAYFAVMLLYVPFSVYSGYFNGLSFLSAARMMIFDGSFYHLWYYPACILGISIVSLLKKLKTKTAFIAAAMLYVIGLFGDSYYGAASASEPIKAFYGALFQAFSYTRNGFFFAPIYLLLGSEFKNSSLGFSRKRLAVSFSASFSLMTAEAFLLMVFKVPRHDSMYIFMIPTMLTMFALLLSIKIKQQPILRKLSMWIYIIHPAVIILLRGASKIISSDFFTGKELLLYFLTTVFSAVISVFIEAFAGKLDLIRHALKYPYARVWAEIDLNALKNNVEYLRKNAPKNAELMPAIKANAYGHGAVIIAKELSRTKVKAFCVASASEGIELRKHGIKGEILILGYTAPAQISLLKLFGLSQTITDIDYAKLLNKHGKIHAHLAVDTGMRRLGIRSENYDEIKRVFEMKNLIIDGIFTHLSAVESAAPQNREFTEKQAARFFEITEKIANDGYYPKQHLLSSCGLLNFARFGGDYVRAGIAIYGGTENSGLKPVLSLKTRVTSIRNVFKGEHVGYGLDCIASEDMRIAVLAAGYADGLPRALSDGKGAVLINGRRAPIIGKVCMDMTLADVSGIDLKTGDIAVIIGSFGGETITACDVARAAGTIPNEILSRLGTRVPHVIK